jgi:hypothetical protein
MANETIMGALNRANPNGFADIAHAVALGDLLTQHMPRVVRGNVPAAAALTSQAGLSEDSIVLPPLCKAGRIRRGWARSTGAAGTLGELTVTALGADPGAGEIAVAPNGDIVFRAIDAYTSVDVDYMPEKGRLVTLTGVVVVPGTGVCTLPLAVRNANPIKLVSAVATAGGVVAAKTVGWRAAVAPATTFACLSTLGTIVYFAIADAVTLCNLTLIVQHIVADPHALLVADNTNHV